MERLASHELENSVDSSNFTVPYEPGSGPGSSGGLRLLRVEGDGAARGKAHGEEFRDLIAGAMERWRESLVLREKIAAKEYIEGFLSSTGFAASAKELSPDLYAEVEGIAAGSGQPFDDVLVYNLMDEEWRYERDPNIGCSTVGTFVHAGASDNATPVLGQNMDLPASMGDSQIVLQAEKGDGPDQIVLSGAGMIGLLGVNAAGLAVCVNTLRALPAAAEGLPVAFVIRELLLRTDAAAAAADYLGSIPHASGQHYALGDPAGIRAYECSSEGCVAAPSAGTFSIPTTFSGRPMRTVPTGANTRLKHTGPIRGCQACKTAWNRLKALVTCRRSSARPTMACACCPRPPGRPRPFVQPSSSWLCPRWSGSQRDDRTTHHGRRSAGVPAGISPPGLPPAGW